jgi:hypothetical protein
MKPTPNRKLGDPIPPRLILTPQGTLKMVDGSDPADYLKAVRRMWKVRGNVEICVIRRVAMEDMERDAFLYRNRGA